MTEHAPVALQPKQGKRKRLFPPVNCEELMKKKAVKALEIIQSKKKKKAVFSGLERAAAAAIK